MPELGWDSVTVHRAVSSWVKLSERYGRLAFADLFESAIEYAEGGFLVGPKQRSAITTESHYAGLLRSQSTSFQRLAAIVQAAGLARSLRLIAETGALLSTEGNWRRPWWQRAMRKGKSIHARPRCSRR